MTKDEIRDWTYLEIDPLYGLATSPVYGKVYYKADPWGDSRLPWVEGISVTYDRRMIERWRDGPSKDSQETVQDNRKGEVSESRSRHSSNG